MELTLQEMEIMQAKVLIQRVIYEANKTFADNLETHYLLGKLDLEASIPAGPYDEKIRGIMGEMISSYKYIQANQKNLAKAFEERRQWQSGLK